MLPFSGDFEVLFLMSFHCFVVFVIVYATVKLWKYTFMAYWFCCFGVFLQILILSLFSNRIKLDSFIQSRKELQELHKIYLSHFVSLFTDLNVLMRFFCSGGF